MTKSCLKKRYIRNHGYNEGHCLIHVNYFPVIIALLVFSFLNVPAVPVFALSEEETYNSDQHRAPHGFTIQVGSYSKHDSAIIDAKKLEKHDIDCVITKGKKFFKLYCGKFDSSGEAHAKGEKLSEWGHKDTLVLRLKNRSLIQKLGAADHEGAEVSPTSVSVTPEIEKDEKGETKAGQEHSVEQDLPAEPETESNVIIKDQESKENGLSVLAWVIALLQRNLIVLSLLALTVFTALFFALVVILRRMGTIKAIRIRKLLKQHADLLNNVSDDDESIDNIRERLKEIGNPLLVERLIDEAAEQSESPSLYRDLYDSAGVTDKYISILEESGSWKKRAFACEKLGLIGSGKSVPSLLKIINDVNDEDEDVRMVALRSLGRIRDRRAIASLIEALGSPETWLPPRVAEILLNIGEDCIEPLRKELKNFQSESRRGWSAEILGWLNATSATSDLIDGLLDASQEVRAKVAGALGKIKDKKAIPKLTELLISEPVSFVRTRVSQALGAMGDPAVIHHLVNILKDPEWWVRVRAVEALEQIGDSSIPSLLVAMEDEDQEVRRRSALALEKIGYIEQILSEYSGEEYKPELRRILFLVAEAGVIESLSERLFSAGPNLKKKLVRLFGEARTKEASGPLIELLKDTSDWTLKARIIQSLGKVGAKESIPLLIENLKDSEYWVRRASVESIGMLEGTEFSDDISLLLNDPNPNARESALRSLMMLKVTHHWDKIEKLLFDPSPSVRRTALKAIRVLGITTERSKILETLTESSEEVRIEAIKYFSEVVDAEVIIHVLRLLPYGTEALRKEIVAYVKRIKPESFSDIRELFNVNALSRESLASLMQIASVIQGDDAYRFLLSYTESLDAYLREHAFRSIANFGFAGHEAIFEKALFDPARAVRTIVLACVGYETDDSFLEKAKVLAKDPDENVRLALCLAFGASGFKQFRPLIIAMLDDPSHRVVTGAFISLASLNDPMFLEIFYKKKDIKELRKEIQTISEDERFTSIIEEIRKKAEQSRNLEIEMLFAKSDWVFSHELVKKLKESLDPVIRMKAMEMLKLIATPDHFTSILSVMKKDPYADVRVAAMDVLSAIGREGEVISALSTSLSDPAPVVRNRAAELLGTYRIPKSLEALLYHLDTPDRDFREAVTTSLSELLSGDAEKVTELVKSVPENKTRKIGMAWLLGKSRKKGSITFLMDLLNDEDHEVRAAAVGALGKFRKKQLLNHLEKLIYDPNERVRAAAVNAIAVTGGDRAFDIVQSGLEDIDDFVRMRATIGLAKLNIKKAIAVLKAKAARYPEFDTYLKGLLYVSGESYADASHMNTFAINIVSELCDRESMMKIFERSSEREKRIHAFRVLNLISGQSNYDLLSKALKDPVPEIRKEANKYTIDLG